MVLTGLLFPLAILGASRRTTTPKPYYAWLLLLEAGCIGVFLALDLFLFFVLFEIVLVPMYFLIGGWGYADRRYAATKFFLYTMFGSAFMLVGIVATAVLHAQAGGGDLTFDLVDHRRATRASSPRTTGRWLFLSFAIAFAVKVPLFPLHTWLPDAHTQAPTAGSVILAGVMLKLGTYGFLRFGLYLFPEASVWFAPGAGHARRDRHHLRRHRAPRCRRTSSGSSPTPRWPTSASSCSAPSRSPPRASRAACCRWSTTASPPAPCSSSSA